MDFGKNNNEPAILTREDEKTDNIEKNTEQEERQKRIENKLDRILEMLQNG